MLSHFHYMCGSMNKIFFGPAMLLLDVSLGKNFRYVQKVIGLEKSTAEQFVTGQNV